MIIFEFVGDNARIRFVTTVPFLCARHRGEQTVVAQAALTPYRLSRSKVIFNAGKIASCSNAWPLCTSGLCLVPEFFVGDPLSHCPCIPYPTDIKGAYQPTPHIVLQIIFQPCDVSLACFSSFIGFVVGIRTPYWKTRLVSDGMYCNIISSSRSPVKGWSTLRSSGGF